MDGVFRGTISQEEKFSLQSGSFSVPGLEPPAEPPILCVSSVWSESEALYRSSSDPS